VDIVFSLQNFCQDNPVHGPVTGVIFFQNGRFEADFASPISHTPSQLVPVPETSITSTSSSLEFYGDNGLLHVCGSVDRFSAETGPQVTEVPGDGRTPSGPAVVTGKLSDISFLEVFVRGGDDHIYLNVMTGLDFTSWREVPPGEPPQQTVSEPAAAVHTEMGTNVLRLFVRGSNSKIYQNKFTGSPRNPDTNWSGWSEVPPGGLPGGGALSGPAAVVDSNGMLRLFVSGLDNRIYENDFRGGSFGGWNPVHGDIFPLSAPAAVVRQGVLKLFARDLFNRILENDFSGGNFTEWHEVNGGGLTFAGPSALVDQGILKLFVAGLDDGVWENNFDGTSFGGWSPVSPLGYVGVGFPALTPSAPAAVEAFFLPATRESPATGYPTVFLRGEDGRILQGFF
jgi:hypothetical protein